ncbi:hypothetical protein C1752_00111 [Acaryochloris thomasi RCC1774]|uniref:Uncharacterized protein n=1 Tax=Acaryochloris thomasi RCC1774 TaxID=1764569 RepID=A0A2W1JQA0_9CYAN|nr:hypothetical protein C1752_00111 [Acaryochloris thomasi RCC1774]
MATCSERTRRKLADLKTILGVWMLLVPKGLYIIKAQAPALLGGGFGLESVSLRYFGSSNIYHL